MEQLLRQALDATNVTYQLDREVKRGLGYYIEDGFEARCPQLGAQQQIAGGGRYAEGIGWAIGLDRLLLALARRLAVACTPPRKYFLFWSSKTENAFPRRTPDLPISL